MTVHVAQLIEHPLLGGRRFEPGHAHTVPLKSINVNVLAKKTYIEDGILVVSDHVTRRRCIVTSCGVRTENA